MPLYRENYNNQFDAETSELASTVYNWRVQEMTNTTDVASMKMTRFDKELLTVDLVCELQNHG